MIPIAASSIAAQAFREMEVAPIGSFADDSPQAQAAREQYPLALRLCLEAEDWSFARRVAQLPPAAATDATDPELQYLFDLPSDCIRLRLVSPETVCWRIDGRTIRADTAGPLQVRYTGEITNEVLLPATFQTAVALALAVRLAPQWVSSRSKRVDLRTDFADAIDAAKLADRHTAAHTRLDGRAAQDDWAGEAVR